MRTHMHIQGKRWFQRSCGTTYNSVTIYVNGCGHYLPMEYGYGDHYLQRAIDWLIAESRLPESARNRPFSELRLAYCVTHDVCDVTRQKDL